MKHVLPKCILTHPHTCPKFVAQRIKVRRRTNQNSLPVGLKNVAHRFLKAWATFLEKIGNVFRNYGQCFSSLASTQLTHSFHGFYAQNGRDARLVRPPETTTKTFIHANSNVHVLQFERSCRLMRAFECGNSSIHAG